MSNPERILRKIQQSEFAKLTKPAEVTSLTEADSSTEYDEVIFKALKQEKIMNALLKAVSGQQISDIVEALTSALDESISFCKQKGMEKTAELYKKAQDVLRRCASDIKKIQEQMPKESPKNESRSLT